jgi:hypothetical protein
MKQILVKFVIANQLIKEWYLKTYIVKIKSLFEIAFEKYSF